MGEGRKAKTYLDLMGGGWGGSGIEGNHKVQITDCSATVYPLLLSGEESL